MILLPRSFAADEIIKSLPLTEVGERLRIVTEVRRGNAMLIGEREHMLLAAAFRRRERLRRVVCADVRELTLPRAWVLRDAFAV